MNSAGPVMSAPGRSFDQRGAGTPLASDVRMLTMITTPGLTLVFLLVVLSLGIAFVWMLWEMEQMTKARLAKVRRDSGFG
jgi:hypothetical protein